jgi:hypothetical protein
MCNQLHLLLLKKFFPQNLNELQACPFPIRLKTTSTAFCCQPLLLLCHKLLPDSNVICHVWRFLTVEAGYGSQVWSAR